MAQRAATCDPKLPLVQEALSTVHLFKREHKEAIAAAERWLALEPSNAEAYATLAGAKHFAGENEEVIALIEKAMRLNPFYPFYYLHYIGIACLAMRRLDQAATALRRGVSRNPDALWPHVFLASCYGHRAEHEEAARALEQILRLKVDFSAADLDLMLPYKDKSDVAYLLDGLRKAGLT